MRTIPAQALLAPFLFSAVLFCDPLPIVPVDHQPFGAQVLRLLEALDLVGDPLPTAETAELNRLATTQSNPEQTVRRMQEILDRHCLAGVNINPESRVKKQEGTYFALAPSNSSSRCSNFEPRISSSAAMIFPSAPTRTSRGIAAT